MSPRDPAGRRAILRTLEQLRTLGREIRQARLTAGLTQEQVATAASISRRQQARIEAGWLRRFDAVTVTRVLTAVGLELGLRAPSSRACRSATWARSSCSRGFAPG